MIQKQLNIDFKIKDILEPFRSKKKSTTSTLLILK